MRINPFANADNPAALPGFTASEQRRIDEAVQQAEQDGIIVGRTDDDSTVVASKEALALLLIDRDKWKRYAEVANREIERLRDIEDTRL